MLAKLKFLIASLFLSNFIFAQTTIIDSLLRSLNSIDVTKEPQTALNLINQIYSLTYQNDPQTSIEKLGQAINISTDILKDSVKKFYWLDKLGNVYLNIGKYDQAMKCFIEENNFYEKTKDSVNYAYSLYNLGNVYIGLNVDQLARQQYETANEIFLKNKESQGIVSCNIQIVQIFSNNYQMDSAFNLLYSTLKYTVGNDLLKAKIYKKLGDLFNDSDETDSSIYYFTKASHIFKKINSNIELGNIFLTLGSINIDNQDFVNAKKYIDYAETIFQKTNYKQKLAQVNNLYGRLYFEQNNYSQSQTYFFKSLEYSQLDTYFSDQKLEALDYLSKIFTIQKDYAKANEYLTIYINEQQNVFNQKAKQGYAEVILTFQNEEKLRKIELLQKEDDLKTQQLKNQKIQVLAFAAISILLIFFAVILFYYFRKQKNINKLLQEQNHQIYLQKKEIESQSRILEKATRDLLRQKDELQVKSHKITSSIVYASRIQKAMLPNEDIFKKNFQDYFIFYQPKETVSGDFYWITEINSPKPSLFVDDSEQPRLLVAVVDCTGHGVPGAFMSMLGEAFLNQIVNILHIFEPDKVLYELHKSVRKALQQEQTENNDGMDIALVLIDKENHSLQFSGAKNPLIYIQNDTMNKINGSLLSVGGMQKEKDRIFERHTIDISTPTTFFLYSDGFQDQFGGEYGRKYMAEPFRKLLYRNSKLSGDQQKFIILTELNNWKSKKYHQMDDITIVGVKI